MAHFKKAGAGPKARKIIRRRDKKAAAALKAKKAKDVSK